MKLELSGIDVVCIIGERADERVRSQHLRVDVALTIGDRASETDSLADTVDYAVLTEKVRSALVAAKCQMIERAARVVCEACLADDGVLAVSAKVTKFGAIAYLESASVTLELSRQDLT